MKSLVFSHEHVTIDLSGAKQDPDCRLDNREAILAEYRPLLAQGVDTIVDQTARGMGRSPRFTQDIMDELGLRVLHATGYYKEPFLPEECYSASEQELVDTMVRELTHGMDDTGLRASLIGEIGTSRDAIMPMEEKIFRAAARAHKETGAPICTHTTLGRLGLEQLAIFKEFDVDLSHVVLSHVALAGDFDYICRLVDSGVNVAFDTIGKLRYESDENRANFLAGLIQRGYLSQIVMSMDITRQSHYKQNGGPGFGYLMDEFVPLLRERGVAQAQLQAVLSANPRRIYKFS